MKFSLMTLAIESAVAGGSLSLFSANDEIVSCSGSAGVSRAEDLLFNVDAILSDAGISKHELDLIAVSAGPGSFTGVRIGIATALGLKMGLDIAMSSESVLQAMAFDHINDAVMAAVPMGSNSVCIQRFTGDGTSSVAVGQPETLSDDGFADLINAEMELTVLLHEQLYEKLTPPNAINCGSNLSKYIARICRLSPGKVVEPLFVSKSF